MADSPSTSSDLPLQETPLAGRHVAAGGRMVGFAGYSMPVQYPTGILAEHAWTRQHAGLFDVSHMGQAMLLGPDHEMVARALEMLVPADIVGLAPGQQRYTQLLNDEGGILDDLMVCRPADPKRDGELLLVVNASMKQPDYIHIAALLPEGITLRPFEDRALLALQGPEAVTVLSRLAPGIEAMTFMAAAETMIAEIPAHVTRSGYTGEDGFEISVAADAAGALWDRLTADPTVKPIGLGARDSLRLEADLPLYGHDLDTETTPVSAALGFALKKRRREEGGFPGHERILLERENGPILKRVGLIVDGRQPVREGAAVLDAEGSEVGRVTSGGFAPTVQKPIAMAYVPAASAVPGTKITLAQRGKLHTAEVAQMPFVPHRYVRKGA
jgi:aminomethyltransferase